MYMSLKLPWQGFYVGLIETFDALWSCNTMRAWRIWCIKTRKWRDNLRGSIPTRRPIIMTLLVVRTSPRRKDLLHLSNKVQSLQVVNMFLTLALLLLLGVVQLNALNAWVKVILHYTVQTRKPKFWGTMRLSLVSFLLLVHLISLVIMIVDVVPNV